MRNLPLFMAVGFFAMGAIMAASDLSAFLLCVIAGVCWFILYELVNRS